MRSLLLLDVYDQSSPILLPQGVRMHGSSGETTGPETRLQLRLPEHPVPREQRQVDQEARGDDPATDPLLLPDLER